MNQNLKKIRDVEKPCLCPEHNPPMHMVLDPGVYEYTCPACGQKVVFTVRGFYCEQGINNA